MPDISNSQLLEVICVVLRKIEAMEEKFDKVLRTFEANSKFIVKDQDPETCTEILQESYTTPKSIKNQESCTSELESYTVQDPEIYEEIYLDPKTEEHNEQVMILDYLDKDVFNFKPINNDAELYFVSEKMESDDKFCKKLKKMMEPHHAKIKLQHIFTEKFLSQFKGVNCAKKFEGLVPYELLYVEPREQIGYSKDQILKEVNLELMKIKNRIRQRRARVRKTGRGASNEEEDEKNDVKMEENDSDEDSEDVSDNEDETLIPINNEKELKFVSKKLKKDSIFLKSLRIELVQNSEDAECSLAQIFSEEFLADYNLHGTGTKKSLNKLAPYKMLYEYLKRNLGHSETQIERDVLLELGKIRSKVRQRLYRKRKTESRNVTTPTS